MVQVVTGIPGAGKTQLAAAYARARLAAGWQLVAWVNAADPGALLADLAAVADAVGVSEGAARRDAGDPSAMVRHQLEAHGERCLLVFDNAEDRDVLRPVVPAGGGAHVLITSERPSLADLGESIPVGVFTAGQALAFLAERTGLADDEMAAEVAAELGYLPLALAQAATVIARQHLGYGAYLERLRVLPVEKHLGPGQGQPYPRGVAEAVLLTLDAARAYYQPGVPARVLEIIAVLSGAGIGRALLHTAGQVGTLADGGPRVAPAHVDRALGHLAGWSLLTFSLDGQTIVMHPLVAQVVRAWLTRRERSTAACRAAAATLEARARGLAGSADRPAVREFPRQVGALLDNMACPAAGDDKDLTMALLQLRLLALYHLIELGDSAPQAVAVGEPLTTDLERILGADHPDTLNARNSLAAAYQDAGRAAEAIPLFQQILAGRERMLGPEHPNTLTSQDNLAAAYQDAGRAAEAILLFELTMAARVRLLGTDHPSTLTSRGNLAAAYRDTGRVSDAIPLLEQTLSGRERTLGTDHPRTLAARNNLGQAYRAVGRAAEAVVLHKHNLAGCERVLGTDHPRTKAARNNLAAAYQAAAQAG